MGDVRPAIVRRWSQMLDRSRSEAVACVWRRAWLTAPKGKLTLAAAVRSLRPGERLRVAAGVHAKPFSLPFGLEVEGEDGAVLAGPVTLDSSGRVESSGRVASIRNLTFRHFYDPAVVISGGSWVLERSAITSSRGSARAGAGIVLRRGARLDLRECDITSCSSAVLLSSPDCELRVDATRFSNAKVGIASDQRCAIDVRRCVFDASHQGGDVGCRLAHDTVGVRIPSTRTPAARLPASHRSVPARLSPEFVAPSLTRRVGRALASQVVIDNETRGSLWGRGLLPPVGVRTQAAAEDTSAGGAEGGVPQLELAEQ